MLDCPVTVKLLIDPVDSNPVTEIKFSLTVLTLPKAVVAATPVGDTLASHVTVSSPKDIVEAAPETPVIAAPAVITLPKAVVPTTPVS